MRCYVDTTSSGTWRCVIPVLREYRKAQLILNFLYVATHFPPRLRGWIHSFSFQSETFYLQRSNTLKNRWFCVLRHNPHGPEILKNAIIIDLVIQSDFSQQLLVWVHQSKPQLKPLVLLSTTWSKNLWYWSSHQNLDSPKFPEICFQKWFILIIERVFLHNYRFNFLHGGNNQQPDFWRKKGD